MKVQFLGHAGLLIDSGKTRLLMDAWLSSEGAFDASWYQLPQNHHIHLRSSPQVNVGRHLVILGVAYFVLLRTDKLNRTRD